VIRLFSLAGALAALVVWLGLLQSDGESAGASDSGSPAVASLRATWAFRPDSLKELADNAPLAVTATVAGVEPGEPLIASEDVGEPDEPSIPTQRIVFDVEEILYGSAPAQLVLLKTGSADTWIDDDPPYQVGERYLLLLTESTSQPGLYVPPAPDGRMLVVDGVVQPLIAGPIAETLGGRTEEGAENTITQVSPPQ